MKIVLVHNTYQQAGGEDVVFAQESAYLRRAGHNVILYQRSNWEIEHADPLSRIALAKETIWSGKTRREFAALLAKEKPDLVHVHNTFVRISPSIYSACQEFRIPVVQTLHNFRLMCPAATLYREGRICESCLTDGLWSAVRHKCYRDSRPATATVALMLAGHRALGTWTKAINRYIALTEFSRTKFVAAGFPAEKIAIKPNFVDPDPGPRTGQGDYALYIGRLSQEKGPATLLEAWERLPVCCPLQIVGDGPDGPSLEALVQAQSIRDVTFRGKLSREETIATLKGARFLIVPSVCYEGFPMVIAEAMACGVPVICSRLGGMQELVSDGVTGLHFSPSGSADLAEKVNWAWSHPSDMSEMGLACRREYEARYTANRNYSRLMQIYERALNRAIDSVPAVASSAVAD